MKHVSGRMILNTSLILSALMVLTCLFYSVFAEGAGKGDKVCINEVCSSDLRAYKDENGDHPDYIELYNDGDNEVDLTGWKISRTKDGEDSWSFPEISIPGKGFLILNADGTKPEIYPDEQRFSIRNYIMTGRGYAPSETGTHVSFELPSKGTELFLSDDHNALVDSIEVPELSYDTVYGRVKDGDEVFIRMKPSPGESNNGSGTVIFPTLSEPVFSAESGFYDDAFYLSLFSPDGGEIRYTKDGSIPGRDSALYTGPLLIGDASSNENVYSSIRNISPYLYDYYDKKDFHIPVEKVDKCNVIRARVFDKDGGISPVATGSYFVNFNDKKMYDGVKVISLVSDPENFFGEEEGIFVMGKIGLQDLKDRYEKSEEASALIKADPSLPLDGSVKIGDVGYNRGSDGNYMQHGIDWEREAELTLFSEDHDSVLLKQNIGVRIKGNSSRQYPLKGLNLYARKAYSGSDLFELPFFGDGRPRSSISLSAGGNDRFTMTKDSFMSGRIRDTGLDVAAGRFGDPVYLFLDGEFWGAYVMAERLKEDFFASEYGVSEDNVIFIKEGEVGAGRREDIHYYYEFLSLYEDKDLSKEEEYRDFCDAVDIESLMEYYSIRIYSEYGIDWPHLNYGFWRCRTPEDSPYGDCRWRFVNFDNNVALSYENIDADMFDVIYNGGRSFGSDQLFTALMKNKSFRSEFRKKTDEVNEKVFLSGDAEEYYKETAAAMRTPCGESYGRWYGGRFDISHYDEETGKIERFIKERNNYYKSH